MESGPDNKLRRSRAVLSGQAEPPIAASAPARVEAETVAPPACDGETGGPKGPEPTRFGDWERKGRCIDF